MKRGCVKIGDCVDRVSKWKPGKEAPNELVKYIDTGAVCKDKKAIVKEEVQKVLGKDAPSRARQLVKEGDVLVSTIRPNLNGVAQVSQEWHGATASTGFSVLRPNERIDGDYLFRWLMSPFFVDTMISQATGASYPAVSNKIVCNSEIPLPPLEEQKRIAGILDEADRVRKKTQVLIDKYDELAQSLFLDMFGDPVTNPKGWEVKPLGELTSSKPDYGAGAKAIPFEAGLPRYIRITDIDERGDLKKECVASDLDEYDIARYLLKEGDFLFARSGATVGKTFRYSENQGPCVFAGYLIRFQLDPDVMSSKFLSFLCRTEFYAKWVANSSRAVAQPNINAKIFSSLPVIVPPLLEQQKFLSKNEVIEKDLVNARNQMESMIFLFKSLLQKAFKGELT